MTVQRKWIIHILLPHELCAQAPLVLTNYASKLYNTVEILELELKFCTPQHRLNFTKFYTDSETEALLNCSVDKCFPQWKLTHCYWQIITFPHLNTPFCRQSNNSQKRKVPALISWWGQLFYTFSTRDCHLLKALFHKGNSCIKFFVHIFNIQNNKSNMMSYCTSSIFSAATAAHRIYLISRIEIFNWVKNTDGTNPLLLRNITSHKQKI